ncbi:centromere protein J-like [Saccostrea echinata]|uniref:centromere protein J-like n=1 Tax=Saccostrea echinata TaxID=191078 RepID=UPI002A7ED44C|nr:centromere protein J-like [Saccostrea echinata]
MNSKQKESAQRSGVLVDFEAKPIGKNSSVNPNGPHSIPVSLQNTLQSQTMGEYSRMLPNMFLQTINFDAAFHQLGLRGNASGVMNDDQDNDEEDSEVNPLERQQVMEQALLLQRFKELRQWQMQQQESLMNQQKQQLELLRKEQMVVKSVISKNKDSKKGGMALSDDALTRTPPHSQRFTRPREIQHNSRAAEMYSSKNLPQQEPMHSSGQLPVPVMYVPFNDDNDEINTNPDLFSDTNSRTSEMTEERLYREEMIQRKVKSPEVDDEHEDDDDDAEEVDDDEEELDEDQIENLSDSDLEEGDFEEEEDETEREITDPDERPILVTKTFEELLEEQLKAESEKRNSENQKSVDSPRHQFLKKGEGTARYGSAKERKGNIRPPPRPQPEQTLVLKSNTSKQPEKIATKNGSLQTNAKTSKTNIQKHNEQKKGEKILRGAQPIMTKPTASKNTNDVSKNIKASNTQSQMSNKVSQENSMKQEGNIIKKKNVQRRDSIPDDASFVGKLREREIKEEFEKGDLEEFELLENLADNMSYCSNTSVMVQRMEDRIKETKKRQTTLSLKPLSQTVKPNVQKNEQTDKTAPKPVTIPTALTTVTRSESPMLANKELPKSTMEEPESETVGSDEETESDDSESSDSDTETSEQDAESDLDQENVKDTAKEDNNQNAEEERVMSPSKLMKRKIAQKDKSSPVPQLTRERNVLHLFKSLGVEKTIEIKTDHINDSNDLSETDDSEKDFQMHSKLLTRSTEESDSEGSLVSYSDLNIKKNKDENKDKATARKTNVLEYDDEEEWGETTLTSHSPQASSQKTKPEESDTPPTSKLMTKLFPKLKKEEPKETKNQGNFHVNNVLPSEGVQSKLLREKLAELDKEIEKFRNENVNLQKLRKEREEGLSKLKKEVSDFEKEKSEELKRIQEYKTEEMKKLRHEKKVFEQLQKAKRNNPDKKEREEIEMLKTQLRELQEELKRKELRWASNDARTKEKLKQLEQENSQLKEEIKAMERKRLEWLQKEKNLQEKNTQGKGAVSKSAARQHGISTSADFQMTDSDEEKDPVRDVPINRPASSMSSQFSHKSDSSRPQFDERSAALRQRSVTGSGNFYTAQPENTLNPKNRLSENSQTMKEDVPRDDPVVSAVPQDTSMYTESGMDGSYLECVPRKTAQKYSIDRSVIDKGDKRFREIQHPDGKVEKTYSTGVREILFPNGTRKEISADGKSVVVSFCNGDVKQITADQRVIYYYAEVQTTHSTYPDGLEIIQFPNNQVEKHYPEGTKEIIFPDQTIKYLFLNGSEESIFPDGTVIRVDRDGTKTMEFPNGQKEIHTQEYKRREYPDGTVKTVYPDGRQETKYSNGRIRVKDRDGNVIIDRRS